MVLILLGLVAVPVIEGGLSFGIPAAAALHTMSIVVPHQSPAIRCMERQRIGDAMRFFGRCFDSPDPEASHIPAVVDNRFTIEIEQICERVVGIGHTQPISVSDMALQAFPAPRHIALAGWDPAPASNM
jgi:hypothetical protein